MPNLCIFIFCFLVSFSVHANTTKRETLNNFLNEIYDEMNSAGELALSSQIEAQLQNHFPTCPLKTDLAELAGSAEDGKTPFLEATSCDELIDEAKTSSLSRLKINNLIMKLDKEGKIDNTRQGELLASLEEIYGSESSQKIEERVQLINHLQNCDSDYGIIDKAKFWSDAFGCKGIIETAKEAGITYSEVRDAIEVALPAEEQVAQIEVVEAPSDKPKPRQRTSKP